MPAREAEVGEIEERSATEDQPALSRLPPTVHVSYRHSPLWRRGLFIQQVITDLGGEARRADIITEARRRDRSIRSLDLKALLAAGYIGKTGWGRYRPCKTGRPR